MAHLTLLGDSIFDNNAYVGENGKDVITHLRELSPDNWQSTLCAVDGNVVENVPRQLIGAPRETTHFFISVGGNNAIMNADILGINVSSSAEVFDLLSNRVSSFEFHYRKMLENVLQLNLPTTVCTIYYPRFPDPVFQKIAVAALSSFNDVIIKQAILYGIPILDLRLICNEDDDYANEIEPSSKGGKKIVAKILEVMENHNFSNKSTIIYF